MTTLLRSTIVAALLTFGVALLLGFDERTFFSNYEGALVTRRVVPGWSSFLRLESGVSFTWKISQLPQDSSFDLHFDGNKCKSQSIYGDNDCHYNWGDTVSGQYKLSVQEEIVEGDTMTGHFKVRQDLSSNVISPNAFIILNRL